MTIVNRAYSRACATALILALSLLSGCSMAALMNEQTINQRLDSMDARLRALETAKAATDARAAQEPVR
jgi:outer membrane murein-binding lipoprotein Lpp